MTRGGRPSAATARDSRCRPARRRVAWATNAVYYVCWMSLGITGAGCMGFSREEHTVWESAGVAERVISTVGSVGTSTSSKTVIHRSKTTVRVRSKTTVAVDESQRKRRLDRLRKLPHVSECKFCNKCHLTEPAFEFVEERHILNSKKKMKLMRHPAVRNDSEEMRNYAERVDERSHLRQCDHCKGCTSLVNTLGEVTQDIKGRHLEPSNGFSRAHVFRVSSQRSDLGVAIGKVMCLPFWKDGKLEPCSAEFRSWLNNVLYPLAAAQQRVSDECGLSDIVPRMWVENVTAIMPDTGYVIHEPMAMQEVAQGAPLKSFHKSLSTRLGISTLQKINSTEVILAAVHDLLFSMEDRHADNIFVDDNSHISLIDNDKVLRVYGGLQDSLFLPTTSLYEYQIWGREWVKSHGEGRMKTPQGDYMLMMDYRCHVDQMSGAQRGQITLGTNYPETVSMCLAKLAGMTDDQVMDDYGFPELRLAKNLRAKAESMIGEGFEYALDTGKPLRPHCKSAPWRPPCCSWDYDERKGYEVCTDTKWKPRTWQQFNCVKNSNGEKKALPNDRDWSPRRP